VRPLGWAVALALAPTLLGCGDPALWARYRAERDFWHARKKLERMQLVAAVLTDPDYASLLADFRRVADGFPPSRWVPASTGSRVARDIAEVSGRAALMVARIEALRGREDQAVAAYDHVRERYRPLEAIALEATAGRARALEGAGRYDAAVAAWLDVVREFPLVDSASAMPRADALAAPFEASRLLVELGDRAAADSVMRDAARRCERALDSWRGREPAPELWLRLGDARDSIGDHAGAIAAARAALAEPRVGWRQPRAVMAAARHALDASWPDSALAYSLWGERDFHEPDRSRAMLISAQAYEARGSLDSALVRYERWIDTHSNGSDTTARVRYRRGQLYERLDHWEQARTEYRALAANQPTHPLAFEALRRIVEHHAARGERELAAIEASRGLEAVEQLITVQSDPAVLRLARRARAELLLDLDRAQPAFDQLVEAWRTDPDPKAAAAAGMRAAEVAETRLSDPARALEIYRRLAAGALAPESRRRTEAALARLSRS
jgi:tetratricopeptide (TPR) repeat protein